MGRLIIFCAALLMVSALSLVTARFQSRQLFVQVHRLEDKARDLATDWRRLQLERAELARKARIDGLASKDLELASTSPDMSVCLQGAGGNAAQPGTSEGRR